MFADKEPLPIEKNTADEIAIAGYNKHQPRTAVPFCIVVVQSHTVKIDENDVSTTVSIHRIAASPGPRRNNYAPRPEPAQKSGSSQSMSDLPRKRDDWASKEVSDEEDLQAE